MSGRVYTVSFTEVAITAAVDMFELTPADDKPIEIIGMFWGNSSDFGDAQAEQIPFRVIRGQTTSGSGGSTSTPRPLNRSDAAAGFTCEINNTTPASAGTAVDLHTDVINAQAGYALWLPETCEWSCTQADTTIVIRYTNAPVDSVDTQATLYVREWG